MAENFFSTTGNFVARDPSKVDRQLVGILEEAANRLGVRVQAYSGYRPGDRRFHGRGIAADVRILDDNGVEIPNYQDARGFSAYEKLAQEARKVQMEKYPHLDKRFRWGGYFGGPKGKYGAMDLMHFDLGGSDTLGMKGGSWEGGLSTRQAALFPGAKSRGLGMMALVDGSRSEPNAAASATSALATGGDMPNAPDGALVTTASARKKISDPALLQRLNAPEGHSVPVARKKVADPALLEKLNAPEVDSIQATNTPDMQVPEVKPRHYEFGESPDDLASTDSRIGAFLTGVADLPVVGPVVKAAQRNFAAAAVAPFSDQSFGEIRSEMARRQDKVVEANPGTALAGNIVGTTGVLLPAGATSLGGQLLGITGRSLGTRVLASGASNSLMNAADTAVRGGDASDIAKSAGIGVGLGLGLPLAGAGLNALGRSVVDTAAPRVNAIIRPGNEAARRVGSAIEIDRANPVARPLGAVDEASAAINNQSLMNVDRGGEATRALARSAANLNPEAREVISRTTSDRFASQGERAQNFINRVMNGATDDLALQDQFRSAAATVNKPAYDRAFNSEAAQDLFTPGLTDLMRSPAIMDAIKAAETRGANRSVIEGFKPVKNPFVFDESGAITLRRQSDGSIAKPTLQFWDQVKRNLDSEIGKAKRAGDKTLTSDLTGLKNKLVGELDTAVPEYRTARQGAAAFFGAEDALDAGKKFVTQNKTVAETNRALLKMAPQERDAFAVGFASEMKDAIAASRDRTNVIDKLFGSQQARDKIKLALGQDRFKEFEQFVRIENTMDMLRGAMGNSSTARQLVELGLAGTAGGGAAYLSGDWKAGLATAALVRGGRAYGTKIDASIAKKVADLLISDDPKALEQAVQIASKNKSVARAIEGAQRLLSSSLKSIGNTSTRPEGERRPLEITVNKAAGVEP